MKNKLCLWLALAACSLPAAAGTDIGVSVGISQPGFYGRIDIGTVSAPPVLVYPQPVIITRPVVVQQRPIYLHVPPGHAKKWHKHCVHYSACGQPVYFVREDWYRQHYAAPQHPGKGRGKGHDKRG